MPYNKYKDAPPEQTISKIQECFSKIGIQLKHDVNKRIDGIYSSVIIDAVGGWATAGKGTTPTFCLASGYAEAMEHFCNYCAYDLAYIEKENRDYLGFERYPDEIKIDLEQLLKTNNCVVDEMISAYCLEGDVCDNEKLKKTWSKFLGTDKISLVPYYSVKKGEIEYLPEAIVGKLCGSTGGGAGNTFEEAIGHGLDEISERYAKYMIYSHELTPPEIPKNYIKKVCPDIYEIINNIENQGYRIIVLDGSLGRNFPVVAVCLVDKKNHSYVINFGSHPCFAIALERCLTEMFQFMSLNNNFSIKHKQLEKWSSFSENVHSVRNWVSLLRDDTGRVPNSFFADTPSWEFVPWGVYENYNNMFGMELQINNFLKDGVDDIYIRDFSFLGFPVYRIYIPNYSVSHYTICDRILNDFENGKTIMQKIVAETKKEISTEENKKLQEVFSKQSYIDTWIIRDIKESYLDLLYAALIKEDKGEDVALELIKSIDEEFSLAILEDYNMAGLYYSEKYRDKLLSLFYDEMVVGIVSAWRNHNTFISMCLLLKKYRILTNIKDKKPILELQEIHRKFKETMNKNTPRQEAIGDRLKELRGK